MATQPDEPVHQGADVANEEEQKTPEVEMAELGVDDTEQDKQHRTQLPRR